MTKDTPHDEPATASTASRVDDGDIAALEQELQDRGVAYARATVVRREPPVSANVGDRAVVTADGELYGWVGGAACAQSVVTTQAQQVLESGQAKLVGIAPDPETVERPGLEAFPMTCHSEGVLEVFIEPVAPTTRLVLVGDSPITRSLARLAGELSLDVTLVAPQEGEFDVPESTELLVSVDHEELAAAMGPAPLVVVASMGEFDARGIAAGVLADARYVGLVASDERAAEEIDRAAGLLDSDSDAIRAAVTNPAGVDIVARTPAEIAAAILAELVDVRSPSGPTGSEEVAVDEDSANESDAAGSDREAAGTDAYLVDDADDGGGIAGDADGDDADDGDRDDAPAEAVDPVCGMTVDTADPSATVEHEGKTYYFCCQGCADSFRTDPDEYLEEGTEATP